MSPIADDDPRRDDELELRARQIVVHGLTQREHGTAGLFDAIDAALGDVDAGRRGAGDAFARALGLLFTELTAVGVADLVAERLTAGVPGLILKIEGKQDK